mmetsp:Transcript_38876/g.57120  ORF Transcript_38876/g.57120 Transcript_38876/m.57120 type:complete len:506 (+) Transcript_38876:166-1683(+)
MGDAAASSRKNNNKTPFQKTYAKIPTTQNQKTTPWRNNNERHYCPICNVWMSSDTQSVRLHEGGKKHLENVKLDLEKRRSDKLQKEKEEKMMVDSLKRMERVANEKLQGDLQHFDNGHAAVLSESSRINVESQRTTTMMMSSGVKEKQKELSSWQTRKRVRQTDDDDDTSLLRKEEEVVENKKVKLPGPNEGHYTIGDATYLEGEAYAPILEPDMPIQLWIGPNDTPKERQHSMEMMTLWKMGLILKVYDKEETITCDVAYLRSPTDTDETIEKSIPTNRIRILLGSDADDDGMIPNTLEEARLMLLGGEEEIMTTDDHPSQQQNQNESSLLVVDENTGLSSWGTVSIRRVTVQKEIKEERSRQRQKQRDEKRLQDEKERERLERKMEEAKHANGDDSALGAYDVWSTSGKGGYKGVNIHGGIESSSSSSAKVGGERKEVVQAGALSKGKGMVAFKKRKMIVTNSSSAAAAEEGKGVKTGSTNFMFSKKMNKKKKHRRTTFADDD